MSKILFNIDNDRKYLFLYTLLDLKSNDLVQSVLPYSKYYKCCLVDWCEKQWKFLCSFTISSKRVIFIKIIQNGMHFERSYQCISMVTFWAEFPYHLFPPSCTPTILQLLYTMYLQACTAIILHPVIKSIIIIYHSTILTIFHTT